MVKPSHWASPALKTFWTVVTLCRNELRRFNLTISPATHGCRSTLELLTMPSVCTIPPDLMVLTAVIRTQFGAVTDETEARYAAAETGRRVC